MKNKEMRFSFCVLGNPTDPKGNPVPCPRLNYRSRFSEKAKKYNDYREMIRNAFMVSLNLNEDTKQFYKNICSGYYPITRYKKAHVNIFLEFVKKGGRHPHPDCDNVLKGVLDALFENDNRVAFSVDFSENNICGKMSVEIKIEF